MAKHKNIKNLVHFLYIIFSILKSFHCKICSSVVIDPSVLTIEPPNLPDAFETRLEVNFNNNFGYSQFISFDYQNRRAHLSVKMIAGLEFSYFFDYENNEIHAIEYVFNETTQLKDFKNCKTYPLDSTDEINKFFGVNRINGSLWPNSVYQVFKFEKNAQLYNGTYLIRGIPCDAYISCTSTPQGNATSLSYFSRFNHPMPFNNEFYNREPVRTIIKGVVLNETNQLVNFEETYDYYEFKPNYTNPKNFQTPRGVFCENRKPTKPLPKVPKRYAFSEETTVNGMTSYIKHLMYDEQLQAVRYELRNYRPNEATFYTTDPFIFVHDYNVGVSYATNKKTKECTIKSLGSSYVISFDTSLNLNNSNFNDTDWFLFKLKSPEGLLLLDSDYIYVGKRMVNNVLSDVYMSNRSTNLQAMFTEFAFSDKDFVFMDSFRNDTQIPVSLNIKFDRINTQSSFYDYESDSFYKYTYAFDVSDCFSPYEKIQFSIRFMYKDKLKLEQLNENYISTLFDFALTQYTNESFTRFSRPRVSISADGSILIRSAILAQPPAISLFSLIPNNFLFDEPLDIIMNITLDSCAEYCLTNDLCLSFDYLNTYKYCRLNPTHVSEKNTTAGKDFDHYSKNIHNRYQSKSSNSIYFQLIKLIENKAFQLSLYLNANNRVELTGEDFKLVIGDNDRYGTTSVLSKYHLKLPNRKFAENNFKIRIKDSNIDDCAKSCTDSLSFECRSFDYCYLNGECRLNSEKIEQNSESKYIIANECDIYEQDQLYHYKEFPFKATINTKDVRFKNINSVVDCAQKCDNQMDIHCRSFNYCPTTNECYLSERHLLDMADTNSDGDNLICTHYSRDYFSDYVYTSSSTISLDHDLIFNGASVEQCSLLCTTADGFYCDNFYYCQESKKCLLKSNNINKNKTSPNLLKQSTPENCANYKREYSYVTDVNKNDKNQKIKDSSEGVLIGLSITFSLIGLAIGFTGSIYLKKKQN